MSILEITRAEARRKMSCLIFGPSGAGKTRFIASANEDPRTSPVLLLDYEGGTSSLIGLNVDLVEIRSWADFNQVYDWLAQGDHPYRSIGIDSISELHVFALLHILGIESGTRKDPDLLQQGDYGKALVQMRRLSRSFRDLPYHTFFSALSKDDIDPREGLTRKPALSGILAEEFPAMMEVAAYLASASREDGEVARLLLLKNYPKVRVKVRTPYGIECPDEIWDPTVTKLLDALGYPLDSTGEVKDESND